jgi:ubiquinone/menaquinone biosynthesis C-methylase UbiE
MKLRKLWQKRISEGKMATAPEDYWRNLGEHVIGNLTKEEMLDSRQTDTYSKIAHIVIGLGVAQVTDLGCNVGITGVILREAGYTGEYVGIDANPNALPIARQNLSGYPVPFTLVEGNLRELHFSDNSFECNILKDVLEHMEDFRAVLREALRVSAQYTLVANFIPWSEGETIVRREPAGYYHNLYSRKDVYAFIRDQGFRVVSVTSALEKDARPNEIVLLRRIS